MAGVVVEEESFLLWDSSILIKLWEAYVAQSNSLLSHDVAGQGFDVFAIEEVFHNNSFWKARFLYETTGGSWV